MLTKVRIMIVSIFGTVLRELRENKKLSQEKLAEFCDLDRTYISLLERGLRQPTLTTLFKLSDAKME
jgi:transcriptional regulator with XRE-family HTH domain